MDETEKAFAYLLGSFHIYGHISLSIDLDKWENKLDL